MKTIQTRRVPRVRRTLTVVGTALAFTVATALPAFAHASFPKAKNPRGGTGVVGSTPPYAAGSTPTITLSIENEQPNPFHGSDDSAVDVKAIVPVGWTSPKCGAARNAAGAKVAKWTCNILTSRGHKVVHWSGPQVKAPATAEDDAATLFTFSVKVPAPAVKTTYNGKGKTEGFIVDQRYASGAVSHWIPSAGFRGTPPTGAETEVAAGLARTVAAKPK